MSTTIHSTKTRKQAFLPYDQPSSHRSSHLFYQMLDVFLFKDRGLKCYKTMFQDLFQVEGRAISQQKVLYIIFCKCSPTMTVTGQKTKNEMHMNSWPVLSRKKARLEYGSQPHNGFKERDITPPPPFPTRLLKTTV